MGIFGDLFSVAMGQKTYRRELQERIRRGDQERKEHEQLKKKEKEEKKEKAVLMLEKWNSYLDDNKERGRLAQFPIIIEVNNNYRCELLTDFYFTYKHHPYNGVSLYLEACVKDIQTNEITIIDNYVSQKSFESYERSQMEHDLGYELDVSLDKITGRYGYFSSINQPIFGETNRVYTSGLKVGFDRDRKVAIFRNFYYKDAYSPKAITQEVWPLNIELGENEIMFLEDFLYTHRELRSGLNDRKDKEFAHYAYMNVNDDQYWHEYQSEAADWYYFNQENE